MNTLKNKSWLMGLAILAAVGCSKDDPDTGSGGGNGVDDRYFMSVTVDNGAYMMAVDDLEKDTVITTSSAIESEFFYSHYVYNQTNAVLGVNYAQQNASPGAIFQLSATGQLREMDEFLLPVGFSTIGAFDKYLVASRSGRTLTGTNAGRTGAIFYLIDLENNNNIIEKSIVTENFIGNKTAEFAGAVDAGNGEFLSGVKLIAPEGTPAASHDSVYVAKFDADLNLIQIYDDNRISYSVGEFAAARYPHLANDANGHTYVFSGSHSATTTKKAGALVIRKGSDDFDQDYYFDIEAASGGYRFKRLWHVTEDYFLLEMYNITNAGGNAGGSATQYAVVRMSTKEFNWVRTGIPGVDDILVSLFTPWPVATTGKIYIGITPKEGQPSVYAIDPKTATAKKGITVNGVTSILGLARLTPQADIL